jgi:uncharacterized protein YcfL
MAGWVAVAVGCAAPAGPSGPTAPARPAPRPPPSPSAADQRYLLAPELERILQVEKVHLTNSPGGFLKIQVNVMNKTQAPQWFAYRIDWFDQDGARLPLADKEFTPWMLLAGEKSLIAATAPAPSAVDFEIAFVPYGK